MITYNITFEDEIEQISLLTLYLIDTPLNTFANRADPDQAELPDGGLLCLLMEIWLDMILH